MGSKMTAAMLNVLRLLAERPVGGPNVSGKAGTKKALLERGLVSEWTTEDGFTRTEITDAGRVALAGVGK